ncbi:DUF4214 domain-containing protein [Methylobacterium soli]|uniref:DUF4214 domain-containing protein n=2 Tax=Methylobacterium soli TaxID=553447 RepID=A0A6L3SZJ0_9HYPH|nr:DUF4214 domain-containing protein [Methylobacterium soli]KAB1078820.1 DUF4214 domain-containing protein [Methylobacterium soli]
MPIVVDGSLADWQATQRLDTSGTGVENYALYGTLQGDNYIFGLQSPIAIGPNTTFWLNTDHTDTTGGQAYDGSATGAEYFINFAADGKPYLYSGTDFGAFLAGPLPAVFSADGKIVEFSVSTSQLGDVTTGFDLKIDVNDNAFLPTDYSIYKYTLTPDENSPNLQNQAYFGSITTDVHSFGGQVFALYDGLLGRGPDSLGLEYWADKLEHGTSVRDVGQQFLFSAEGQARAGALDNSAFVQQLYQATLHRDADSAGLSFWTEQLNNNAARIDVANGFIFSEEHLSNLQPVFGAGLFVPDAQAADVARLYYTMLDRAPDAGGLEFWTDQLEQGGALSSLAQGFLATSESQAKYGSLANSSYVDALYENALGRHADADGLQFWTARLDSGTSRADLAVQLSDSAEAHTVHVGQIELGWHLA